RGVGSRPRRGGTTSRSCAAFRAIARSPDGALHRGPPSGTRWGYTRGASPEEHSESQRVTTGGMTGGNGMAPPERRRSPRRQVDWTGWYQLRGETTWHVCRFMDISQTGAAIQTPGIAEWAAPGCIIEVRLDAGNGTRIGVRGEIRN